MRTVGQILKEERERKFYTLDEIEKVTKIRKELLEALENDDYSRLPPPTFIQGFIKNYGRFLGLDVVKLLAVFRRENSPHKHPPRVLESFRHPIETNTIRLTPAKVLSVIIAGLVLVFFAYLWFEYRYLAGSPLLEVYKPKDQETVLGESIVVEGKVNPETKVAINSQEVPVDSEGRFAQELKVSESVSKLFITATSKFGKVTTTERVVYLKR